MSRREVVPGTLLGEGGQGRVFTVTSHPGWAVKLFNTELIDAEGEFAALANAGMRVEQRLQGANVELVWPKVPVVEGRSLNGFLMPLVPVDSAYVVTIRGSKYQSTMDFAVPRSAANAFRPDVVPTREQRVQLLLGLARFLEALHAEDHVYVDLSWRNCLYRLDPYPIVLPLDLDSVRRVGGQTLHRVGDAETIDWTDPWPRPERAGFDQDRYKFALMVYRMLLAENLAAMLPDEKLIAEHVHSTPYSPSILKLLRRAALGPGGRPSMTEWVQVLS